MVQICRTCLEVYENGCQVFSLEHNESTTDQVQIKTKLQACVPEIALHKVKNSVICCYCLQALNTAYNFKTKCLQTENKLFRYLTGECIDNVELSKFVKSKDNFVCDNGNQTWNATYRYSQSRPSFQPNFQQFSPVPSFSRPPFSDRQYQPPYVLQTRPWRQEAFHEQNRTVQPNMADTSTFPRYHRTSQNNYYVKDYMLPNNLRNYQPQNVRHHFEPMRPWSSENSRFPLEHCKYSSNYLPSVQNDKLPAATVQVETSLQLSQLCQQQSGEQAIPSPCVDLPQGQTTVQTAKKQMPLISQVQSVLQDLSLIKSETCEENAETSTSDNILKTIEDYNSRQKLTLKESQPTKLQKTGSQIPEESRNNLQSLNLLKSIKSEDIQQVKSSPNENDVSNSNLTLPIGNLKPPSNSELPIVNTPPNLPAQLNHQNLQYQTHIRQEIQPCNTKGPPMYSDQRPLIMFSQRQQDVHSQNGLLISNYPRSFLDKQGINNKIGSLPWTSMQKSPIPFHGIPQQSGVRHSSMTTIQSELHALSSKVYENGVRMSPVYDPNHLQYLKKTESNLHIRQALAAPASWLPQAQDSATMHAPRQPFQDSFRPMHNQPRPNQHTALLLLLQNRASSASQQLQEISQNVSAQAGNSFQTSPNNHNFQPPKFVSPSVHQNPPVRQYDNSVEARPLHPPQTLQNSKIDKSTESTGFKCNRCNYQTHSTTLLDDHLKGHNEDDKISESTYKCAHCAYATVNRDLFKQHRAVHLGPTHHCDLCNFKTKHYSSLRRHQKVHTGNRPYRCTECRYGAPDETSLEAHMRYHRGKPYQCSECEYSAIIPIDLEKHVAMYHKNLQTHKVKQSSYFISVEDLQNIFEGKDCETNIEEEILENYIITVEEVQTILNEPLFRCSTCNEDFQELYLLKNHMRSHNANKPYQCSICSFRAAIKSHLQVHMKSHSGGKFYRCDLCHYATIYQSNMRKHKRVHTGEKPYKCPHCDYRASQRSTLKGHINIHTDKLKCDKCLFVASSEDALEEHLQLHLLGGHFIEDGISSNFIQESIKRHFAMNTVKNPEEQSNQQKEDNEVNTSSQNDEVNKENTDKKQHSTDVDSGILIVDSNNSTISKDLVGNTTKVPAEQENIQIPKTTSSIEMSLALSDSLVNINHSDNINLEQFSLDSLPNINDDKNNFEQLPFNSLTNLTSNSDHYNLKQFSLSSFTNVSNSSDNNSNLESLPNIEDNSKSSKSQLISSDDNFIPEALCDLIAQTSDNVIEEMSHYTSLSDSNFINDSGQDCISPVYE